MSDGSVAPPAAVSIPPAELPYGDSGDANPHSSILRSASYAQLPPNPSSRIVPTRIDDIRRSFSENVLADGHGIADRRSFVRNGSKDVLTLRGSPKRAGSSKRLSIHSAADPKTTVSKFTLGEDQPIEDTPSNADVSKDESIPEPERVRRSVSGSLSKFARKSWMSTSRSPSPSPRKKRSEFEEEVSAATQQDIQKEIEKVQPVSRSGAQNEAVNGITDGQMSGTVRRNSFLGRKSRRPLSALIRRGSSKEAPSVPPIPKSFSTDKLPSLRHKPSNLGDVPAVPRSTSYDRLQGLSADTPRKKDELWSVFRSLDGHYQKFQSRPSTTKTAVVRSSLLPFLKNYAEHPSIASLRPEDLDRRTVILNKWWTGLLEMLNGRHGESVSGNDRPTVLEAVTALMVRPEWTLPPPLVPIRSGKTPRASLKSRSTTSLSSTMSDFLVDSVFHNVKNIFTQNLLAQMAYVVEKMSTRNVAASVVTFCGKATAYAFFYCEGVAEILVRLWAISPETLRRVLVEYGFTRSNHMDRIQENFCAAFPPCLHSLALNALRPMMRYLRSRPHLPIATAYIPWHGPWVSRWAGKDTDLFFIFAKYYIDLACRFLPDSLSREKRMAAPAWALVHAQLLTVLDATMKRSNSQLSVNHMNGPSSITFDDMLGEADATATLLPLPINGMARSIAENRLVMLLRDCLCGSSFMGEKAQIIFADSFDTLLKATARRTSLFDHNACFTLCDFLEEAIAILMRYGQASGSAPSILDWPFWFDVCKRMLQSQNSMTEVRVCAFLYSMWAIITSDEERKRDVCLRWLLTKETFQNQFNHWCPMVRAFFMRLLMWKIARVSDTGSAIDVFILDTMHARLQEVWCQFLFVKVDAEKHGFAAPSTTPCSPAPSRRLLIVRDDVQPAQSGMFLSFDDILSSSAKSNSYERYGSPDSLYQRSTSQPGGKLEDSSRLQSPSKKKWGLLKSVMPFSSQAGKRQDTSTSAQIPKISNYTHQARLSSRSQPATSDESEIDEDTSRRGGSDLWVKRNGAPTVPHRSLSFKFSLEWVDGAKHPIGGDRRLDAPRLPFPAEKALHSRRPNKQVNEACKSESAALRPNKYAGRALAEWAVLIDECQNFFERRKTEGVPAYQMVETPTLGVEPFRKT